MTTITRNSENREKSYYNDKLIVENRYYDDKLIVYSEFRSRIIYQINLINWNISTYKSMLSPLLSAIIGIAILLDKVRVNLLV